ncbi:hypothetical protein Cme02nite_55300 [Catellatospora methionotrophica]|uniref:Uncharacterized protein n=1 Tax=Catellatospora methionotrophica TaxID=121620 RepID=A0A8J3LA80_9ACTN|nr:hypothetical protein [Catellatospora methionotrophica]GIG17198.1 hypothetical protein Cme02nite_55300 [Catellatospora methionotrophica]
MLVGNILTGRGMLRAVAAAICGLVLTTASPAPAAPGPAGGYGSCIATPAEYRDAWQRRQVRCVSPQLFGTTHAVGQSSIYPEGFWYAWAGSNTNLEQYLRLRRDYGDTPAKVGIGVLSYVGYPGLEDWSTPTGLAVYTLPPHQRAQVPSFETWFRLLDEQFGDTGAYPLAAQTDLVYAYSRLRRGQDVVSAFQDVTGCRRGRLLQGAAPSAAIGCDRDFLGALAAAGPSPYDGAQSKACFANFADRYRGRRSAAALRGVLYQCQDAGFLNTGVGLGYNTYANPLVCGPAREQSVRQRYTGREFIVPNTAYGQLPSYVDIPLELGRPGERDFLNDGYC